MGRGLVQSLFVMAGIGAASMPAVAAGEMLVMPFSCSKIGNRIITAPGSPRRYPVLGRHEAVNLPGCTGRKTTGASDCLQPTVHQFDIMCGGKRVAWADVALSVAESYPVRTRQLERRIDRGPTAPETGRCVLTTDRNKSDLSGASLSLVCRQPHASIAQTRLLIPAGFAPIEEAGAVILARSGPAVPSHYGVLHTLVTSSPLPDITPAVEDGGTLPPRLDFAHALNDPANAAMMADPTPTQSGWIGPVYMLVALLGLAGAAAWRWPKYARRAKVHAARSLLRVIVVGERYGTAARLKLSFLPSAFVPTARPIGDIKAANAASAVAAMLSEAQGRLNDLKTAGPLNDVLTHELGQLRQRLTVLQATAAESEQAATRASPGFRNLMRDIERVRRIADSAALSIGNGRSSVRIPATKAEAFDLLGLNPDVAEGTLKKVADGLRMNWHPDHARDDADRAAREARIKAINIAIDLINGKRVAA